MALQKYSVKRFRVLTLSTIITTWRYFFTFKQKLSVHGLNGDSGR